MSARISGAEVREWAEFLGRADSLRILADQMEADAAELERLRRACTVQNDAVCQTLGRVLGYPRYADDQSRFPRATAEDGVCIGDHVAETLAVEVAAALERVRIARVNECDLREKMAGELQRLKPLAAMGEALLRVREHPERDTKIAHWFGGDDLGCGCFTLYDGRITASTWVELADKLDAIAAARVPKPEADIQGHNAKEEGRA